MINKSADELDEPKNNPQLWAECIVGALHEDIYVQLLRDVGFQEVNIECQQDYFSHSKYEATRNVAEYFSAMSITLSGHKL